MGFMGLIYGLRIDNRLSSCSQVLRYGEIERSLNSPRKTCEQTRTFLAGLKRVTKPEPSKSILKLSKKRKFSHKTFSRVDNESLVTKSYVSRRCNQLCARSRAIRVEICPMLFNHLYNMWGNIRNFVDNKKLFVDVVANRQTFRVFVTLQMFLL